jgi:hypothetical protein
MNKRKRDKMRRRRNEAREAGRLRKAIMDKLGQRRGGLERSRDVGTFGPASDVRVLVKDGVEQVGMTLPASGHRVALKPRECRRQRRERALAIIAEYGRCGASALDLGHEMTKGSVQGERMGHAAKERLGLTIGHVLVQHRLVVATRHNRFVLAQVASQAVPPALRFEDMPQPGFVRVPERT